MIIMVQKGFWCGGNFGKAGYYLDFWVMAVWVGFLYFAGYWLLANMGGWLWRGI